MQEPSYASRGILNIDTSLKKPLAACLSLNVMSIKYCTSLLFITCGELISVDGGCYGSPHIQVSASFPLKRALGLFISD